MGITRRSFITASAAGVASVTFALRSPQPVVAVTSKAVSATLTSSDLLAFDAPSIDFMSTTAFSYPISEIFTMTQPTGFTVTVSFDPGWFRADDIAVVTLSSSQLRLPTNVDQQQDRQAQVSYTIPEIPADSLSLVLPVPITLRELYPNENIGSPADLTMMVLTADGATLASASWGAASSSVAVQAWGAEVSTGWASVDIILNDQSAQYVYPQSVTCASSGPTAIPAHSTITLDLDGALVDHCEVLGVKVDGDPLDPQTYSTNTVTDAGCYRTVLNVNNEILPNSVLIVDFEVFFVGGTPVTDRLKYATVSLTTPEKLGAWQRPSQKYVSTSLTSSAVPKSLEQPSSAMQQKRAG